MRTQRRSPSLSEFSYRPIAAAVGLALAPMAAHALSVTVTSNADSGAGTLRDAIDQVNSGCTGADQITFSGPFTIDLASDLPYVNCGGLLIKGPGTADGTSAPVKLTSSTHRAFYGLQIYASPAATVKGMEIYGFNYGGFGRALYGDFNASDNRIHDNSYGMDGGAQNGFIQNNLPCSFSSCSVKLSSSVVGTGAAFSVFSVRSESIDVMTDLSPSQPMHG